MENYPKTFAEFEARFSVEQACRDYLFALGWPDGFRCPRCDHAAGWPVSKLLMQCAACDYQVSATAGTLFQDTHKPLTTWFRAIWWVTSQKTGASALGLKRILGLGRYKTAWTWLHKLRRAMVRPGPERLSGRVEVDETCIGGLEDGHRGRPGPGSNKATIVIAAEEDGQGVGRIRMRRIKAASAAFPHGFIADSIEPASVIHTDGWNGYAGIKLKGYTHEIDFMKSDCELLPRVHRVASLLKRWLLGTHQGGTSQEHLDDCLDEFTFRFNRRTSPYRGKRFFCLLEQAVAVDPAPYRTIIKHVRDHHHKI